MAITQKVPTFWECAHRNCLCPKGSKLNLKAKAIVDIDINPPTILWDIS